MYTTLYEVYTMLCTLHTKLQYAMLYMTLYSLYNAIHYYAIRNYTKLLQTIQLTNDRVNDSTTLHQQ